MSEKRYQVFISSTYEDLKEERKEVVESILETNNIPVGMELFAASNKKQWEIIKKVIDDSDIFLLIIAGRYGSIGEDDNGNKVSYTEMEYEYAVKQNKPIISFVHSNIDDIPYGKTDRNDKKAQKLRKFINQKVKVGRIVAEWSDKNELKSKSYAALTNIIKDDEFINTAVGWKKGDSFPDIHNCSAEEVSEFFI